MSKVTCGNFGNCLVTYEPGQRLPVVGGNGLFGLPITYADVVAGIPEAPSNSIGAVGCFGKIYFLYADYTWCCTDGTNGSWGLCSID